ncbi:hypothetical protein E9229_001731 [Paeniglutamicibacter cryotolerans]|uniref:Uncharacterized protein n=1 Tax=Paeniglutamicibacter cryotolerans TaxID=670079 RepID=A0A839QI43_9MICC|nr:hypothetical protein [Paeniglutamicibacter cryotolerans]
MTAPISALMGAIVHAVCGAGYGAHSQTAPISVVARHQLLGVNTCEWKIR